MERAVEVGPGRPVLVDKFLEDAIEVDVDAISDGETRRHRRRHGAHRARRRALRRQRLLAAAELASDRVVLDEVRRQAIGAGAASSASSA